MFLLHKKIPRAIYGNAITAKDGFPSKPDNKYFKETNFSYSDVINS